MIWQKTYGIPSRDETSRSVILDNNGLIVMITESYNPTPTIDNDTRYWIRFMQIDTSGAIKKDWKEEVTGFEGWSGSMLKFENDYIYTSNVIGVETNFGPLTSGQVIRRDSNFNVIWRQHFGEPDSQFSGFGDMIFSNDNHLLVAGQNVDSSMQFSSARIMKIDLEGELIWEVRDTGIALSNGQSLNIMEGVSQSNSGSIYGVGYTYRTTNIQEGLILKVTKDGCIDTLCTTTAIEDFIQLKEERIIISPNPITTDFSIRIDDDIYSKGKYSIYNIQGNEIFSGKVTNSEITVNATSWPSGLYLIQFQFENGSYISKKVIKQ